MWAPLRLVFLFLCVANAAINILDLDEDSRTAFSIETFAFEENGHVDINVHNYSLYLNDEFAEDVVWGIFLRPVLSKSDGAAIVSVEATRFGGACSLSTADPKFTLFLTNTGSKPVSSSSDTKRMLHWGSGDDHEHEINAMSYAHNFTGDATGRYDIELIVCLPDDKIDASVELSAVIETICYNVRADGTRNYLSAGEICLPVLYAVAAGLFGAAACAWIIIIVQRWRQILGLHYIMLALVLCKVMSLIAYTVHLIFVAKQGQTLNIVGWDVVYFLFSFLDGLAMFVLILLVGSGWSYIKPKLNSRENNMLTIVIVLQVVANIARIFVGESSPGSLGFIRWSDILAIVDIVCCALVLFPIIWSIHKVFFLCAICFTFG